MTGPRRFSAQPLILPLTLAALLALPGCYARRSIPTESEARPEAQVREENARAKARETQELEAQAKADEARAKAEEAKARAEEAKAKAALAAAEAKKAEAAASAEPKAAPKPAEDLKTVMADPAPKPEPAPVEQKAQAEAAKADAMKADAVKADVKAAAAPRQPLVQIASFTTEKNAQGALAWLKAKGYAEGRVVQLEQGQTVFHRVQAGPFQDLAAARKALEELKTEWPQAFIPAD